MQYQYTCNYMYTNIPTYSQLKTKEETQEGRQ